MIISTIPASNCNPQTIVIGRRGTYDTMQIAFDLSYLIENYGSGTAVLAVKRSQDTSAYPAVVTQEDAILLWTVNETDTAYVGSGECQLMWYVNGGLAKTIIYPMVVMRDILTTSEEPPDGYENWIEHLTELGAETQQNAQNAAQSASDASTAKDDAVTAKEAAEAAQQAAETAVTHYPKIENNYWMVWDVDSQNYVSTGIQAEGEDGYSPEISITTITGGHRVTITDKDHPQGQSFDVMDGQGGGGTSDYFELTNKPKINNVELNGNKTAHDLGLAAQSDIPTVPVQSVNGKTGAVVLSAADVGAKPDSYTAPVSSVNGKTGAVSLGSGDIGFDSAQTYQAGTVGAELSNQSRHLNDKQNAPSTAGTAGQVLGLDSNLDPVWVNNGGGSGGAVSDVQINGTSIVNGGVANIPLASTNNFGVMKVNQSGAQGVQLVSSGTVLAIVPATDTQIKSGSHLYRPVVPTHQHESAFYGLAKAAGDSTQSQSSNPVGTYTDEAKAAIKSMLGVADGGGMNIVSLSGTQITQVGADNTFYVCGELTELTFTAPSVGITMIRFVSGTTPTVLTVNGVTAWMFDNDPTAASLEANKTYDINVLNGIGVAGWA